MASVLATPPAGSDLQAIPCSGRNSSLEIMSMRRDPFGFADRRRAQFGNVSGLNAFGVQMVMTGNPRAAQELLMNKDRAFANGPAWSYFIGPFFNRGVMLLDFDEHRHHRQILQQAFGTTALKGYLQEMQPMIAERVAEFPVGSVKLFDQFKALTLDLALEVFLGLNLPRDEADRINKAFIDTVRAGVAYVRKPVPGGRWWKGLRSRKVLEEFFYANIAAKRARETPDLFSVLCHAETDEGHSFADEDVVNHMIFVLMAAHDTSTITMTQMAYNMAKHPEWQDRARAESLELGPELGYDALAGMTALDLVMKESLRLCPPVPAQPRMAVKDTSIEGFYVPEGTIVTTSSLSSHRDPEFFTNPDMFDPERFGPERAEDKSHRFAWMPFGGGVHKCIGLYFGQMEIKTIMHHLLRGYEWSVPADYVLPMDYSALPVPKDRLPVTLRRR
ncbi:MULTISPECIES: cytochrome P450 [Gordonia]|uniref:Cytochrome P450 n=2 Tax=Gordonia alkanivorans TaxID=84096 RepID=W9DDS1_9ACTN|nr:MULTISPECIES: cytochrome P450 [Gordonia]ETA04566.1 cytochrome P450 [Gordonia alkanivorans CGMCC 6845]MDH3008863.1 cytochrome P450 [Gordonia alkanivorans]MDH3012709.1 cytochrome P450 [Gordonia alkanivorans]MDH3017823.1 cytochrome P450 [Gordonia alkanivorans]MDH3019436.1 cytochrome P450 [Gordonia alkanivorans]